MSESPNGQPANGSINDHQESRDSLPAQSSRNPGCSDEQPLFQAPSWDGMLATIEAAADLTEAAHGFFGEIALENPTGVTTELAVHLTNLLHAAIRLRDMFGPLVPMQRPPPVGWPPAVRAQLDILHNRVDQLWTGLELDKAPGQALDC